MYQSTCIPAAEADDVALSAAEWRAQYPVRRKCQYCKQVRPCRRGADPFLLHGFDEVEVVWLCEDCYFLRESGEHLGEDGRPV